MHIIMTKSVHKRKEGRGEKPKSVARGVAGKRRIKKSTPIVAIRSLKPGRDLKKGLLLRTTNTTRQAEAMDSRNHPVLNWEIGVWKKNKRIIKVM